MLKEKRKLYRIKTLRQKGLTYQQRGAIIKYYGELPGVLQQEREKDLQRQREKQKQLIQEQELIEQFSTVKLAWWKVLWTRVARFFEILFLKLKRRW